MESQAFPRFLQPIELSSEVFLQHIEPVQQASQIVNFLRRRLKGNQLLCHQSIAGQQVSINDIILKNDRSNVILVNRVQIRRKGDSALLGWNWAHWNHDLPGDEHSAIVCTTEQRD